VSWWRPLPLLTPTALSCVPRRPLPLLPHGGFPLAPRASVVLLCARFVGVGAAAALARDVAGSGARPPALTGANVKRARQQGPCCAYRPLNASSLAIIVLSAVAVANAWRQKAVAAAALAAQDLGSGHLQRVLCLVVTGLGGARVASATISIIRRSVTGVARTNPPKQFQPGRVPPLLAPTNLALSSPSRLARKRRLNARQLGRHMMVATVLAKALNPSHRVRNRSAYWT